MTINAMCGIIRVIAGFFRCVIKSGTALAFFGDQQPYWLGIW